MSNPEILTFTSAVRINSCTILTSIDWAITTTGIGIERSTIFAEILVNRTMLTCQTIPLVETVTSTVGAALSTSSFTRISGTSTITVDIVDRSKTVTF